MLLLHAIALYATAILLGAMLFFSFALTPMIFLKLEATIAAGFVRTLFPLYYLIIIVLGAAAALTLASAERPIPAALMALVAAFAVMTRQLLIPRLDALRPLKEANDEKATRQFKALHRFSVLLNMAQIVAVAAVLSIFVL
jgi:hypothetical protein